MPSDATGRGPCVIVVEDDKDMRDIITIVLEKAGFEVTCASNGLRLISILQEKKATVILMDVMLSWIDGFELCKALKKNPEFKNIPVIFISVKSSENDVKKGMESGGADYMVKPIDFDKLVKKIKTIAGIERQ